MTVLRDTEVCQFEKNRPFYRQMTRNQEQLGVQRLARGHFGMGTTVADRARDLQV